MEACLQPDSRNLLPAARNQLTAYSNLQPESSLDKCDLGRQQ